MHGNKAEDISKAKLFNYYWLYDTQGTVGKDRQTALADYIYWNVW